MVEVEDRTFVVEVQQGTITIDDQVYSVDLRHIKPLSLYSLLIDNLSHEVFIEKRENQYAAMLRGRLYSAKVRDAEAWERDVPRATHPIAGGEGLIKAPMPGLVLEVRATAGEETQAGDVIVVLESMKMKTDIHCPQDGTIQDVHVVAGDHVTQGQALVTVSSY
jgi:biotin carboxyl carrier protein